MFYDPFSFHIQEFKPYLIETLDDGKTLPETLKLIKFPIEEIDLAGQWSWYNLKKFAHRKTYSKIINWPYKICLL